MKLTRAKVREIIRKRVHDRMSGLRKVTRKSAGAVLGPDGKLVGSGDESFSLVKYMRGGLHGIWKEAEHELSMFREINKTLGSNTATAAGFLIPPEISAELIELLRAKAVIRNMGVSIYNMKSDRLTFNRITGAATGYWVGEATTKTASDASVGQMELLLKEVAGVCKVKNNLLEDADPAVDSLIRNDLVKVLQLAEDLAFIAGTGGTQPIGIYNDPDVPSTDLSATPGFDDLLDALCEIESANGEPTGWLMHPRMKNVLRQLKDGNGRYIYTLGDVSKGEPDQLLGLPVHKSTQIPVTGMPGTNETYIIAGNWSEFAIGQKATPIKMDVSTEAGDAFLNDETWFRATLRIDCGVRQPNQFYIVKGAIIA